MGYFQPIGETGQCESIYEEILSIDGFQWETCTSQTKQPKSSRPGLLKTGSQIIKKGTATKIETQTIYFCDRKTGHCGFIQLMNSTILGGFYKSFSMNIKIFNLNDDKTKRLSFWKNFKLDKPSIFTPLEVSNKNIQFQFVKHESSDCIGGLIIQGKVENISINLKVVIGKGFLIKPDGRSYYSSTPIDGNPNIDRCIRHVFGPCCTGTGYIEYDSRKIQLANAPVLLISALQGLKPNNAAKTWNFATFLSESRCIVCMEFTTPKEYGEQTVTVSSDTDKTTQTHQIYCGSDLKSKHVKHFGLRLDPITRVEFPSVVEIPLHKNGLSSLLLGPLNLIYTYDILEEMPAVLKGIVEKIEGINPYLYQFCQETEIDDEKGISLVETTFIS